MSRVAVLLVRPNALGGLRPLALAGLLALALAGSARAQSLPPLAECRGLLPGERRGASVADAGDLDGDGTADLWVGSPFDSTGGLQAGAVRAVSGRDGTVLYTVLGAAAVDHFGWSLAALADLDGDGLRELAVGAPDNDFQAPGAGAVRVVRGANGAALFTAVGQVPGGGLGFSLCAAGDVDGDGREDFTAGAPFDSTVATNAGSASVCSGQGGASLARHDGTAAQDRFGLAVACAGDVDLDGRPDVLVGADQDGGLPGYARVHSGRTGGVLLSLGGAARGERFGASVAGGIDLDGDAVPDLVVGATGAFANGVACGAARVYSGFSGVLQFELQGLGAGESFGAAVLALQDIDGDGRGEVVVAGLLASGLPGAAGVVRLCSSRTQRPSLAWVGANGGDRFGAALAAAADRDGDGRLELLVGAPKADGPAVDCGAAFVLSTRSAEPVVYCTGKLNSQGCVPSLRGTGFASLGSAASLELCVDDVLNQKAGILLFGTARAATPFLGGTLCLGPPVQRSAGLASGGLTGASDCSGTLVLRIDAAAAQAFGWSAGRTVFAQAWYRDPQHGDGTAVGLSDALEFCVFL